MYSGTRVAMWIPLFWDDGVTALFSNHQANFTRNTNFGQNSDYRHLGLRNGFNLFGWRLRNDSLPERRYRHAQQVQ